MTCRSSSRGFGSIDPGAVNRPGNRPPQSTKAVWGLLVLAGVGLFAASSVMAMDAYTRGEVLLHTAPASGEHRTLPHATHVDIKECAGGWCLVRVGEVEGWIPEEQLTPRGQTP